MHSTLRNFATYIFRLPATCAQSETIKPFPQVYSNVDGPMRKFSVLIAVFLLSASAASAQVELKTYADANGYIDVQKLTCGQLANTFQEDADFLGIWYSGWYNGLGKKHAINVPRVKEGIHNVIVYCKANRDKRIIQAIDVILKQEQQQKKK